MEVSSLRLENFKMKDFVSFNVEKFPVPIIFSVFFLI